MKIIYMTGSFKPFNGHPRNDAVCVHLPASTKLMISHLAKKINHGNGSQ